MDPQDIYCHYQDAKSRRILLSFMGVVTQELMVEYGKLLRNHEGLSENSRLVLFGTFIELGQNILRYSAERNGPEGMTRGVGIVIVSEQDHTFTVSSGNRVTPRAADLLSAQLAHLGSLDAEGLKQFQRERRRSGPPPESAGAGLGLIELSRRACAPLAHSLLPVEEGFFFSLSVPITKGTLHS